MVDKRVSGISDPLKEEQALAVIRGLFEGDLRALVTYLRSDVPIDRAVRTELADYIDREEPPRIVFQGSHEHQKLKTSARAFMISLFVFQYETEFGAGRDAAVFAAAENFGVGERSVWKALNIWPAEIHDRPSARREGR